MLPRPPSPRRASPAARVLLVAAVLVTVLPGAGAHADGGDYQQVVDLTFPTRADASFSDSYDDCRSGCERVHKAADLMGDKHWPLYATVTGEICSIDDGEEDSYGRHLTICGEDGRRYRYLHVNNDTPGTDDGAASLEHVYGPGIERGAHVLRGQLVGYLGDSGNAEAGAPHLHLDIFDDTVTDPYGDNRINPYPSLVDALARGDVADGSIAATEPADRIAGPDRVGTAIELSRTAFDQASHAVVAPSTTPAEAIVAGPLAAELDGPVLTTPPELLDPRVLTELVRLGVERVTLVGETVRHAGAIRAGLGLVDDTVVELAGSDRFETAALVAAEVWRLQGAASPTRAAVIALGDHPDPARAWPDSLMASYYGAARGQPVLLVRPDEVPPVTLAATTGVSELTVVGGTAAIPDVLVAELVAHTAAVVDRLAGATRYSTALAITDDLLRRELVTAERVWAATGANWPDAATSGPVVARSREALVLVDGAAAGGDAETLAWLVDQQGRIASGRAIGGRAAVSSGALFSVARSIT